MSAADKICALQNVRRFKLVSEDGWHGMTVRPDGTPVPQAAAVAAASAALSGYRLVPATTPPAETPHQAMPDRPSRGKLASMTLVSFLVFAAGFLIAGLLGTLTMTR